MFLFLLGIYRTIGTTHLGGNCRFYPSCSEYAVQVVHSFQPMKALSLIIKRLLKCHPFSEGGYDPIPYKSKNSHF